MADGGIDKVDLEVDLKRFGRFQPGESVAFTHLDHLTHFEAAQRCVKNAHPARQDARDEGRGGAVEDRNLRPVDLHQRVVDAATGQRRHDVFDGRNLDTFGIGDQGAKPGGGDRVPARRDHRVATDHIGPAEPDPVFGRGRTNGHARPLPGMKPGAAEADR